MRSNDLDKLKQDVDFIHYLWLGSVTALMMALVFFVVTSLAKSKRTEQIEKAREITKQHSRLSDSVEVQEAYKLLDEWKESEEESSK